MEVLGPQRQPKQFVLCFDGTGNKFAGDGSDTNLVKIYRVSLLPWFYLAVCYEAMANC